MAGRLPASPNLLRANKKGLGTTGVQATLTFEYPKTIGVSKRTQGICRSVSEASIKSKKSFGRCGPFLTEGGCYYAKFIFTVRKG